MCTESHASQQCANLAHARATQVGGFMRHITPVPLLPLAGARNLDRTHVSATRTLDRTHVSDTRACDSIHVVGHKYI